MQVLNFMISPQTHEYYREHMVKGENILHAIVVKDMPTKIIANIYTRFEKPKAQTRVFTSIEEATKWIDEAR